MLTEHIWYVKPFASIVINHNVHNDNVSSKQKLSSCLSFCSTGCVWLWIVLSVNLSDVVQIFISMVIYKPCIYEYIFVYVKLHPEQRTMANDFNILTLHVIVLVCIISWILYWHIIIAHSNCHCPAYITTPIISLRLSEWNITLEGKK